MRREPELQMRHSSGATIVSFHEADGVLERDDIYIKFCTLPSLSISLLLCLALCDSFRPRLLR